ncbi:MAG: hypothetical protein GY878_22075 [Fuerstiella sp.]|nr:hypothetical protein [Fuerstiella sp.]
MNTQLKSQIVEYSTKNAYVAEHFTTPKCGACGCETFTIVMNENEGVAARICTSCNAEHGIGDSDDFIDDVEEVYPIECTCGANQFKIMAGVALYDGSEDVRWFYLGCECVACGLSGVYGDWKNEFNGFRELLGRV